MNQKSYRLFFKKGLRILRWTFLCYLLYFIICITIPFSKMKEVSEEFRSNFSVEQFYSDSTGVDRAMVVEDSLDALNLRLNMIEQAKETILFSTFSMKQDVICEQIFSAVYAAAERGIKVLILGDGLSCSVDMGKNPMYYALGTHPNVTIRFYNNLNLLKPWTFNGRMHDKYIIIDDQILLLGGRNTSGYFLGNSDGKHLSYDRDILVYNTAANTNSSKESVITQVRDYFYSVWNLKECTDEFNTIPFFKKEKIEQAKQMFFKTYQELCDTQPELFKPTDYMSMTLPTNKITLITNPTHIMSKEPYILYELFELMKQAKERVWIQSPYLVFNDTMYKNFQALSESIPDFRVLLNSTAVGDNFMASSDYTFNRSKVLATGAQFYEFQGNRSTHNKSLVIDDEIAIIGSFNFDMRSVYLDTEVMLIVHGKEFTSELAFYISKMQNELALPVLADGSYGENLDVEPAIMSKFHRVIYPITSVIFQLFRYLL